MISNMNRVDSFTFQDILIYHIPSFITQEDLYFHISSTYGNDSKRLIRFPKDQPKMVIGAILVELEESLAKEVLKFPLVL